MRWGWKRRCVHVEHKNNVKQDINSRSKAEDMEVEYLLQETVLVYWEEFEGVGEGFSGTGNSSEYNVYSMLINIMRASLL